MASDPRKKAVQLIALAVGSNSVEEARTAAMTAVRLIHEHKMLETFVGVDPGIGSSSSIYEEYVAHARRAREREAQSRRRPAASRGFVDDLGDEFMDMAAGVPSGTSARQRREREAREAEERRREEEKKRVVYEKAPHTAEPAQSLYEQTCCSCGEKIRADSVFWRVPTNGAFAAWCMKHAVKLAPPKPPEHLPRVGYWGTKRTSTNCCSCGGFVGMGDRHFRSEAGPWCSRHTQEPGVPYPPQFGAWLVAKRSVPCFHCEKMIGAGTFCYVDTEQVGVIWCLECQGLTEPPTSD